MRHEALGWRQDGVKKASGKPHDGVKKISGRPGDGVRMASGNIKIVQFCRDGIRMRHDGVREASEVCQGGGVCVKIARGYVRRRQEGVRVACGKLEDTLASRWRQGSNSRLRGEKSLVCCYFKAAIAAIGPAISAAIAALECWCSEISL